MVGVCCRGALRRPELAGVLMNPGDDMKSLTGVCCCCGAGVPIMLLIPLMPLLCCGAGVPIMLLMPLMPLLSRPMSPCDWSSPIPLVSV